MMNYQDKTRKDLIKELQELQMEHNSLKTLYEKDIPERKRAEEALKFTRLILDNAADTMACIDCDRRYIYVNEAFCRSMGYSREELLSMTVHNIDPNYPAEIWPEFWEKLKQAGSLMFESSHRTKEGKLIPVEITVSFFEHNGKGYHCGFARDITGRKKAEEALRLEKENFRHSLDDSPLGVRIATIEGNTIYANRTLLDFYGYDSLEELQKTPLQNRYTPESYVEAQERKHQRECGDLSATDYEISIVRKNGEIRHLQVFRKVVLWDGVRQFQVICNDITERILAEKALRESEERFRNITDQVTDVIFMTNIRGHITYISPSARSVFGYSQEEMISMPFVKFIVKSEVPRAMTEFSLSMRSGQKRETLTLLMKHKDGSTFTGELTSNAFYENDMVTGTIGVVRNVTERLEAEKEIRKSKELLEDLHKHLNEIRENERALISREIHDQIGQSLTALKLDLNRMHKYIIINPEAVAKLEGMIELVSNTIKDVQRISSDLRPGILDDLGLVSAIEWYCDEFEKRTRIKYSLELDNSDYNDSQINLTFFRVLQETLTNVIRHANASSVTIKLHQNQKGTTLAIQDNGIGITREKVESTKSLGLIGMRERVRQFGGKVGISSGKGQGTKLTVFIPEKGGSVL